MGPALPAGLGQQAVRTRLRGRPGGGRSAQCVRPGAQGQLEGGHVHDHGGGGLCDRTGEVLGFERDLPTVCNLHWRMRFTQQAGGGGSSDSRPCTFKPAESEGVTAASSGMSRLCLCDACG